MAIQAPLSKHKRNTFFVYIAICLAAAGYCAWDGYGNEDFIKKHTVEGVPDSTLLFNMKAPKYFVAAAVLMGAYLLSIRKRMVVAGERELTINGKTSIPYDSIKKIDKTLFKTKGSFVISYEDEQQGQVDCKISDSTYDNLSPVLEKLISEIS